MRGIDGSNGSKGLNGVNGINGVLRKAIALVAAAAAGSVLVTGSSAASEPTQSTKPTNPTKPTAAEPSAAGTLRVLLSNDDGFEHPYLRVLRGALEKAGHEVVIVAPAGDRSGSGTGMNFTMGATVRATEAEPGIWSVEGSPGDAVAFGVQNVFAEAEPDVVVSGVNPGPNAGPTANHSGTVGATVAALEAGVPSVAVSAGFDLTNPDDLFPSVPQAADFTVRTVERLAATSDGGPLLPPYTSLNINYPAKPAGKVAFTKVGRAQSITRRFVPDPGSCATCYKIRLGFNPDAPEPVGSADTRALAANDVSVTLLTADWTASYWARGAQPPSQRDVLRTRYRLSGLRP
ncbi:5'/3'-nucleotidase SurE [Streptomyces gobiensis]|uniref:5'/3'-nucleotidase SurE n=1 Tax=Streptomyces gobiensis TaxID=2875706 RepID=UPI001E5A1652|nr:5'/3'-nucleotidase SurE [Streptomyces gobiensis]UGY91667.1 5'/3'-nucleotidase SurE [Streptomyces gobiensis]